MFNKYRKKPVVIEAVQLRWDTWNEICDFVTLPWGEDGVHGVYTKNGVIVTDNDTEEIGLIIPTLEGNMLGVENDYIIKGVQGEFYPIKSDIFDQTYENIIQDN